MSVPSHRIHSPAARVLVAAAALLSMIAPGLASAQQSQNPSPMVEHTRTHPRLRQDLPPGRREALEIGSLFLPERLVSAADPKKAVPLLVVFHAGPWLPEVTAHEIGAAVISVEVGTGSGVYEKSFADDRRFPALLDEARQKAGVRLDPVTVAGWSAGCGAIRALLRQPTSLSQIESVLAIDGIHTSYTGGKPGPLESQIDTVPLEPWAAFAREAKAGRKGLFILHTEIFPGTFASTTETADWLIGTLGLTRRAVLEWGPMSTQRLSDTRAGRLWIQGYAGNSAPDHVDLLHALPDLLRMLR